MLDDIYLGAGSLANSAGRDMTIAKMDVAEKANR
jgi:hypothetical protein